MKLLHLSSIKNRDSILKNGMLPSKISLDDHYELFKDYGLKESKCVYTWDPNKGQSTDKYIRDMIYCKLFIHPRNDLSQKNEDRMNKLWELGKVDCWDDHINWVDFSKLGSKLYGESGVFDIFEVDIDETNSLLLQNPYDWKHGQMRDDSKFSSCHLMNDKYAHDDKVLKISVGTIPPDMFKLVTSVKSRLYKNNRIGVTYSKNQ
jgi:hypothetical protein